MFFIRVIPDLKLRKSLHDHLRHCGVKAKKDNDKPPKKYPLEGTDWSSCDESDDEDVGMWDAAPTAFGFAPCRRLGGPGALLGS